MADKTGGILATIKTAESNIRGVGSDTLETLSDQIDGIGGMTDKEKALLGMSMPAINEWFLDKADGEPPNTDTWTAVEDDADCHVVVSRTYSLRNAYVSSESASNDAVLHSRDKRHFSPGGEFTKVCFESHCYIDDFTSAYGGLGFLGYSVGAPDATSFYNATVKKACLRYAASGVTAIYFSTDDGSAAENTALTSYISEDTWFTLKIVVTDSDVKCYINGTLRATHTTRVPLDIFYAAAAARKNSNTSRIIMRNILCWGE